MPAAGTTATPTSVASRLSRLPADDAKKALAAQHPDYTARTTSWKVLLDAFESGGGFLDGAYIWPYPREDFPDFQRRQQMARYHNYLETLVDLYVRFMFTQGVSRASRNEELTAWLENVDGAGTQIDDFMKRWASVALVHGHAGALVDKSPELPTGQTRADDAGQIFASVFTAIAIPDWRFVNNQLEGVKLFEAAPPGDLLTPPKTGLDAAQVLLWDRTGWARYGAAPEAQAGPVLLNASPEGFDLGLVPFVILRPKPSYTSAMLGRPLVSNANVIRAMFNRASEEDQILRDQAFSVLTVSVPPDGNVEAAKQQIGTVIGTSKALVVQGDIKYETPDQTVAKNIRDNQVYLIQELYRAAHVRFSRDTLAAESGESIRLQFTELNEMLQGFAKALAEAERQMARCWFAWHEPSPEAAEAAFEVAEVQVQYPTEFFLDDLMSDLEAWAEAIRMDLGPTMTKRIKKRAARRVDPEMPAAVLAQVDQDIDGQTGEPEPDIVPLDRGDPEPEALARAKAAAGA